jgi:hypothetical protein
MSTCTYGGTPEEQKQVLREHYDDLARTLIPEPAARKLYEKRIITKLDLENIHAQSQVPYNANAILLRALLQTHSPCWFGILVGLVKNINPDLAQSLTGETEVETMVRIFDKFYAGNLCLTICQQSIMN